MDRSRKILLGFVLSLFVLTGCQSQKSSTHQKQNDLNSTDQKVIYGSDDRKDLYEVTNPNLLKAAQATVALIEEKDIQELSTGMSRLNATSFQQSMGVCSNEPYAKQPTAAFCSGFLVAPDLIVTAGHCIPTQNECNSIKFVFDYAVFNQNIFPEEVVSQNVYGCAQLIHQVQVDEGEDFAVVRLDRAVTDRTPLTYRQSGVAKANDPLVVIGHPSGLPTKVAGGANVRKVESQHLVANLDTYGGNSGSAVLNADTLDVEGVLVRGENDFVYVNGCAISNKCSDTGCRGEDITKITQALPYLNGGVVPPPPPTEDEPREIFSAIPNLVIPDEDAAGVSSVISATSAPNGRKVRVEVKIKHTYRGDLQLTLTAPNGSVVSLKKTEIGDANADLSGVFGETLNTDESLDPLSAITTAGDWTLNVADNAGEDTGEFLEWKLIFVGETGTTEPILIDEIFSQSTAQVIPDNQQVGITSSIDVPTTPQGRKVQIGVNISHTYIGDLRLVLHTPDGQKIVLKKSSTGGPIHNINGIYGVNLKPDSDLSPLSEISAPGKWKLQVIDTSKLDNGSLISWKIYFRK